jgi:hypothetical protein
MLHASLPGGLARKPIPAVRRFILPGRSREEKEYFIAGVCRGRTKQCREFKYFSGYRKYHGAAPLFLRSSSVDDGAIG